LSPRLLSIMFSPLGGSTPEGDPLLAKAYKTTATACTRRHRRR
jgi:hypothetical protein